MSTLTPLVVSPRILVVDDDEGIRSLIASFLSRNGCVAQTAQDTRDMDRAMAESEFDLIVLDLMMPGEDGLSALKRLQASGKAPPVIMLSAVGSDVDRIIGLEVGADDYLAKPCNPRELLARIRTVLKHQRDKRSPKSGASRLDGAVSFSGWSFEAVSKSLVAPDQSSVYLTDGEASLLRAFIKFPRRVLSRDRLLDIARGENSECFDRAIDVQVSRLRRKLRSGDLIRTVRSEGYMFTTQLS